MEQAKGHVERGQIAVSNLDPLQAMSLCAHARDFEEVSHDWFLDVLGPASLLFHAGVSCAWPDKTTNINDRENDDNYERQTKRQI